MEFVTSIRTSFISVLFFFLFSSFRLRFCLAADTIRPGQSLSGRQTLISEGERFELGFFRPGSSQNQYLGIWFKKVSVSTVVWVANREKPLTDTSGVLKISKGGNIVIQNGNESIFWSTSSSVSANLSTVKLLDTGNLVLIEDDSGRVLWQSFDYPSDTYIPGMKIGINLRTGHYWSLRSWKGSDDPSLGSFSLELNLSGWPEFVFYNGSSPYWRFGPWNGQRWSGVPEMTLSYIYNYSYTSNKDEIAYTDSLYNSSVPFRMVLDESGQVQRSTWHEGSRRWITFWSAPKDECQSYGVCGVFSRCNSNYPNLCKCLPGFEPKSNEDWYLRDWSGGCVRRTALNCGEDGFFRLEKMNLPVTSLAQVDESLNIEDCKAKCLKNCSCTAYANSNVNGGGSGCVIWIGELFDLREFSDIGQEIYLRVASSELDDSSSAKKRIVLAIALATTFSGVLLLLSCGFYFFKKRKITNMRSFSHVNKPRDDEGGKESLEHLLFDFGIIEAATSNFAYKIGEGGFGVVYQGMLHNGQEIAVKRLSKSSVQGNDEFENEVMLVAKLQHWNLVRLLGYCTHGEEKLLIYEYMPNKSLDLFLFDRAKSAFLDWRKRFDIIVGIARGILYLHEDSRLRVIHRDLKSSNILLDADMIPKISDFGIARSFGRNQTQANTRKVVGTYGYMSPEYAMDGRFSVKSDVYSFGVLVLEILSGRKSSGSFHCDGSFSLIGHGWKLWEEGRVLEFMDPSISDSFEASEVLRCIQIGLLCVQESPNNRPDMSSIIFMLGSEATTLPAPKKPPFSTLNEKDQTDSSQSNPYSTNNMTITMVEAR